MAIGRLAALAGLQGVRESMQWRRPTLVVRVAAAGGTAHQRIMRHLCAQVCGDWQTHLLAPKANYATEWAVRWWNQSIIRRRLRLRLESRFFFTAFRDLRFPGSFMSCLSWHVCVKCKQNAITSKGIAFASRGFTRCSQAHAVTSFIRRAFHSIGSSLNVKDLS